MFFWLILFGAIYGVLLAVSSYLAKKGNNLDPKNFVLGGANLGVGLGLLTYSATLFSTFTLMGMPNFFRIHGVGAWIFLGVTDTAMAFLVITIGLKIHRVFKERGHYSVVKFLEEAYESKFAAYVFLLGAFVFLIPYVSIQIKGISSFLEVAVPFKLPQTFWAVAMLAIIISYSTVGGFKAIVYSDAVQGTILLIVAWLISLIYLNDSGWAEGLFSAIKGQNPDLLSVPGPQGLFTPQFLISSFVAIVLMPITQPQLTTRIVAMKSETDLKKMAPSVAFFVIAVILPALFIGMYGAIHYSKMSAQDFWYQILVKDQSPALGGLAMIGLMAAAMSTTDSQLFALGNEASFCLSKEKVANFKTKILIFAFAVASLLLSIFSTKGLVPLARLSFSGTAILAPMIMVAIYSDKKAKLSFFLPTMTLLCSLFFIYTSFVEGAPQAFFGLRVDLSIYILLSVLGFISYFHSNKK